MSSTITDPVSAPQGGGRGVLESAFALLGALEQAGAAGVTRLAADCGLPKTTAHRLLEQLSSLGAVERSRGGYRIGARVFQLGHSWQPYRALRAAVREPMRRLAAATGVTVTVNVLREGADMIVDCVPGRDGLAVPLDSGGMWPWMTASGKALVAGHAERARVGGDFVGRATDAPAPDLVPASWRREAAAIRARGVAFDREEVVSGICCAAVPLHGAPGTPMAALCVITDPAHNLDRLAQTLRDAGRAAGAALRAGRPGM
ncbi:IclR family acetate operon transcriptional repressor [Catenulispora sp. GP43]|uniref:IclR family transcriptional regulator n=1 Tax=Catenulispora sp. GP43 TaxID=3156263 RepID=UPI003510FDE4